MVLEMELRALPLDQRRSCASHWVTLKPAPLSNTLFQQALTNKAILANGATSYGPSFQTLASIGHTYPNHHNGILYCLKALEARSMKNVVWMLSFRVLR